MRLLVDIDGVICRYDFPLLVKNFFGVDLSSYMIYAYDLADVLGVAPVLIDTMFKEQVYGKPRFAEDALETLQSWVGKHEITIYSNRVKYMGVSGLDKWLIENEIPYDDIDVTGSREYEFHIDDSPAKLASTKSLFKLLYDQPWNRKCLDIMESLTRVYNWQDIRKEIPDER